MITPVLAYSAPQNRKTIIKQIVCTNVTGISHKYTLYYDYNASGLYTAANAIAWQVPLEGTEVTDELNIPLEAGIGAIAVQSDTANAFTFHIIGEEKQL